jgi:orotate phosphoribosyltransferase
MSSDVRALMIGLYEAGLLRTWYRDKADGWTLVSGMWSPVYLQLRELCSHPELLSDAGKALGDLVRREFPEANSLVGIAFGGIPLAVSASLSASIPAAMTRKIAGRSDTDTAAALASYGAHSVIEGRLEAGDSLVLVDDLVTGFDSKLSASLQVEHEVARRKLDSVSYRRVAVLVDREQGGAESAREHGFALHSVIKFQSEGLPALRGYLAEREYEVLRDYFENPQEFQTPTVQKRFKALSQAHA